MATRKRMGWVLAAIGLIAGCDETGRDATREVDERGTGQGWFPIAGKMQLVSYEVVDGVAYLDGDIVLGEVDDFTAVELGEREPDRGAALPSAAWPNAIVPYGIDPSLPDPWKNAIKGGIAMIESTTVVRFVEHTNEKDWVEFYKGDGCASPIGKRGGKQQITLGDGCQYDFIAAHELMHALGIYHEQSRSDRDQYVDIHWENIQGGKESNFKTYLDRGEAGVNLGPYDYASIMHYASTAFAKPGTLTITRKGGGTIGDNRAMSTGDISTITALYIAGPWPCGNGVIEGAEQCDFGAGNDVATMYRGGDGTSCGEDWQEACDAGCGGWRTVDNGGLGHDCDIHDWCSEGLDCWMSSTSEECECTGRCGNGWLEAGEACDYGEGNRVSTIYLGGDGSSCGWDTQSVCTAGCAAELTRENGGLADCDANEDCSIGIDCWMDWDGACTCTQ